MPPRHAYWTILVDDQPTAFRAAMQDDLMATFKRLKEKHPTAVMKWFQNGKLWNSRLEAQEAMRERGERGRAGDARQGGGFRDRKRERDRLEWQPKGGFTPQARSPQARSPQARSPQARKPSEKLEWKPRQPEGEGPRRSAKRETTLEWKPRGDTERTTQPRGSKSSSPRRDKTWRPGGEHKDPRQKYKDAKKAKWQRFKKTIRTRWEAKQGKKRDK